MNELVVGAGKIAAEVLVEAGVKRAIKLQARFIGCRTILRWGELRMSYAALLRVTDGQRSVLIRNLHRPEMFAPIGGVYKYRSEAVEALDRLEWQPQGTAANSEMLNDVRGVIPRAKCIAFENWFDAGHHRESSYECLYRELREELSEARLKTKIPVPPMPQFRRVRIVREGPRRVPGKAYLQYRRLEIFDLRQSHAESVALNEALLKAAAKSERLVAVTRSEIDHGRCEGGLIAHTAEYFYKNASARRDEIPHKLDS